MKASERFLQYVKTNTTSDENAVGCPSTPKQKEFGHSLVEEMRSLGISDANMDDNGYVTGTLAANSDLELPVLGLIAHMDTSCSASGENVCPQIIKNYDGGDIVLNSKKSIVMRATEFESLADYAGEDLIVTDGTTLLGADDKAGIAEILTAVETLTAQNIPHGTIKIAFTPDEEIGRGADLFDVKSFGAEFAYTVDGGKLGEIEYENFNAASADVTVNGVGIHPGEAKNKMKNAVLIGMEFDKMLPACEIPSCTEGYEGFHHIFSFSGSEDKAVLRYIVRDHDRSKFKKKKRMFTKIADYLNEQYGQGTVELDIRDSYYNMKEKIEPNLFLIENVKEAMSKAGVTPKVVPIRGGTDGARLSFMGLPCPNLPTGGHNYHGRFEYIPIRSMEKMVEVLVNLLTGFKK